MSETGRTHFLGLDFDRLDLPQTLAWCGSRDPNAPFAYLVTPNVDHIVRLEREPMDGEVMRAYAQAALCLCDSKVLGRLARYCGAKLPIVPGSDLTARLFAEVIRAGDRVCLIGGDAEMHDALRARWPAIDLRQHIPPMGFRDSPAALGEAAAFVAAARGRFTLLAVGSPQQELLACRIVEEGAARGLGLCIGASIEFITGRKTRAPRWMRAAGVEWLHRLLSEPQRLWRRYLVEGPRVFLMAHRYRRRSVP